MKTLKQYLDEIKLKPYQFAKKHKLTHVVVWNSYNGKPVSGKSAIKISKATGNKVPIKILIDPDLSTIINDST